MIRIGQGYDVHRLTEGRELWLCGVKVAHSLGLDGHSDADVAIHALCDALLGALALGDIGKHFPDTDPAYKGIDSRKLLAQVCALMASHGYRLGNADVTIMAQRPRLAPYIEEMRRSLAEVTGADTSRISVKATTTERLGFEGREEGISASAVVLLCSTT
ncbi:MAG: 2-C-methyl-D-erythritol 2,4-cyclodiphosphate synthase [Muribaculaceae bacterium]|nr:2-C-methyl-D-erythritol 2,4-cyclodiphosphate synthase [Muribaculaceae bacterium]